MRILYGAGNRVGANSQLCRFLEALNDKHTVKLAAYVRSSYSLPHIDWTLNALHHNPVAKKKSREIHALFGYHGAPLINFQGAGTLLKEARAFEPDLVISDGCDVIAHIAKALNVRLWYCSPIHLLDGVQWEDSQLRYTAVLNKARSFLLRLPEPEKKLVYSPFGDIRFRPALNTGYEWITPYYVPADAACTKSIAVVNDNERFSELSKILNGSSVSSLFSPFKEEFANLKTYLSTHKKEYIAALNNSIAVFSTGETSYIADAFYSKHNICVAPALNDLEALLNAILVREYSLGTDVHQVELMERFALDELEKGLSRMPRQDYLSLLGSPQLHELCDI